MNIMVIGGGGREHAIIKKISECNYVNTIFALPGNGGIAKDAVCVDIAAIDIPSVVKFAKSNYVDLAVVTPDDPLVLGMVDALEEAGIPAFGPTKDAAIIEGSKAFSKSLMKKYGIPTAEYEVFSELDSALSYLERAAMPIVIKADGLALGKGVIIAQTHAEAKDAVRSMLQDKVFGESGSRVVIEEFLEGPEVTVLAFTDGNVIKPMVSSMDHKRARDGDKGLNTGGMGTIAPNPYYTESIAAQCMETIFIPTIEAMNAENRCFKGCLYFGLMLTANGPKVIEYNCRFGDPETQVVLPLLKSDLVDIMFATRNGNLADVPVEFSKGAACCVVVASEGYPENYEKGFLIDITPDIPECAQIFLAGAKLDNSRLITSGGRVLGVSCVADDLKSAIDITYSTLANVNFENAYYRTDIGKRALMALED